METLKKIFPLSFGSKDVAGLIIKVLLYIVVAILGGVVIWLATSILGVIPAIGGILAWLVGFVGSFIDLYALVGIVITFLAHFNVLK